MRVLGYSFTLALCFIALTAAGQQGEYLAPMGVNPILNEQNPDAHNKTLVSRFYYLHDTISLPFWDDFSADRTQHHTARRGDADVTGLYAHTITIGGLPAPPGSEFSEDTTFRTVYNDQNDLTDITDIPLTSSTIAFHDYTTYPPVVDTMVVWPAYNISDSSWTTGNDDTTFISADFSQDSDSIFIVAADTNTVKYNSARTLRACWTDDDVWVNGTWPIDPYTIGVATFEGLDKDGYPYDWSGPTTYGAADFLTSAPIDLNYTVGDSIYLSFWYQGQGLGNKPEDTDSLSLEFYSPQDSLWHNIWSVEGQSDSTFNEVEIPITNPIYLQTGFRFRFRNYATLSGNMDHWHLDYVYLDRGRRVNAYYEQDAAFYKPLTTILDTTGYSSVPYEHYVASPGSFLSKVIGVDYVNRSSSTRSYNKNDVKLWQDGISYAQTIGGSVKNFATNTSRRMYHQVSDQGIALSGPVPDNTCRSFDFKFSMFELGGASNDKAPVNDTLYFTQELCNYYAYDDGSPEAGYGVNGLGGQAAQEFEFEQDDTLKAVNIHFTPAVDNTSDAGFFLMVWSSLSPENILYQSPLLVFPEYYYGRNLFVSYPLDTELPVTAGETYYIGWKQADNRYLNVGFDKNTDPGSVVWFNATGVWSQSAFTGSLMIRPVFGWIEDLPTSIDEQEDPITSSTTYKLYPNPANNVIYLEADFYNNQQAVIYDVSGRVVTSQSLLGRATFHTSSLQNGMYIMVVTDQEGKSVASEKFLIQR